MLKRIGEWISSWLWLLGRNTLTIFGATLTTFSAFTIISLVALEVIGLLRAPYLGIIAFLILPGVFVLGLLLIPVGALWQRRKERRAGVVPPHEDVGPFPKFDFNAPRTRRIAVVVGFLSIINLFIVGSTTYEGVVYMDSVQFCGQVCHTVMKPEFASHEDSPHSRVECVACHIGPGAPWFVKSKMSGLRQVFAVTFNTYEHPIPTPVASLRPSRDTCEQCHWPQRFTGDRVRVIKKFAEDDANTPQNTVLLMHIGGGAEQNGIHSWHIDPRRKTTYVALDAQRQKIAEVRVQEPDGKITEYYADGKKPAADELAKSETREMDCIDCHNRPTHVFRMPDQAMDEAMAAGRIDAKLPGIKKVGKEALEAAKGGPGDLETIAATIDKHFKEVFAASFSEHTEGVQAATREIQAIYNRNVFPDMGVTWGSYINNLGHTQFPGCFRCHDGTHKTLEGKAIRDDCTMCHNVLALEEQSPQVLQDLGVQ